MLRLTFVALFLAVLTGACIPLPDKGDLGQACFEIGTCEPGLVCFEQRCCEPACALKRCGDDGCGGTCGTCQPDEACNSQGRCDPCTPDCAGRECGDNGCDGSCGVCDPGLICNPQGQCEGCVADCANRVCGSNGCGGSCGDCSPGLTCDGQGQCVCEPDCLGRQCGEDGCGDVCGTCEPTELCSPEGQCLCVPDCNGRQCGADGCGGSCPPGCQPFETCDAQGQCLGCAPDCAGKACGDDGCGSTCGNCGGGGECNLETFQCQPAGQPAIEFEDVGGTLLPAGTHRATFEVRFSEPVTGVVPGGITIDQAAFVAHVASSDRRTWTFEVLGLRQSTSFDLQFTSQIVDLAGNPIAPVSRQFQVAAGTVVYVRPGAIGDGTSPATPTGDLINVMVTAQSGTEVWMAQGTYDTFTELVRGVSFFCGFSSTFSERDPEVYESLITNSGLYATVTFTGAEDSVTRVIDGCSVHNTWAGLDGGQPTVGIDANGASPLITRNRVYTSGNHHSQGIRVRSGGSPLIFGNEMTTADKQAGKIYNGISLQSAGAPRVANNHVLASGGPGVNRGLLCDQTDADIEANVFYAGSDLGSTPDNQGVGIRILACSPRVVNNLIHAGRNQAHTVGVEMEGSAATLSHNTIYAGEGVQSTTAVSLLSVDSHPTLTNNILFAGPTAGVCIRENGSPDTTSDPASVQNNLLFDCPDGLYVDEGAQVLADIAQVNALQASPIEDGICTPGVDCPQARYSANLTSVDGAQAVFVDLDGPDNSLQTLADNDWRVVPDQTGILTGGKTTFGGNCGSLEAPASCGEVGVDFLGLLRLAPVSIGAY
jgi:hypothetical protein